MSKHKGNSERRGTRGKLYRLPSKSSDRTLSRNAQGRRRKAKSPLTRHQFANEWDEVEYLHGKLLYWLYERGDAAKARPYAERLERLLPKADPHQDSIFGAECWSLVNETKGALQEAIKQRAKEIRLIRKLRRLSSGKPYEQAALQGYGYDALADRLNLLATLYSDSGDLDKAVAILEESKRLCRRHGIHFDGEDVLRQYLERVGRVTPAGR